MSRRRRAIALALAAAVCATLAAALAGSYRSDVQSQLGELRPVVVTRRPLPARQTLRAEMARKALEVRRVPARFAPPDAIADPAEALGLAPTVALPPGSYIVAGLLRAAKGGHGRGSRTRRLDPGRRPVEIAVTGAGAVGAPPGGAPTDVDVVVTSEAGPGGGPGRTYVAAEGVALLDLRSSADLGAGGEDLGGPGPVSSIATLALTRAQALRLIQAESFARSVRVIPSS